MYEPEQPSPQRQKICPPFCPASGGGGPNRPGWTLIGAVLLQGAPGVLDAKEKYFPGLQHSWSFEKSGFDSQEGVSVMTFTTGALCFFDELVIQISKLEMGGNKWVWGLLLKRNGKKLI